MPYLISTAFDGYYSAINLPGDHRTAANSRKEWIVTRLRTRFEIVDSGTIGSVPRFTALRDKADVDVLVALHHGRHVRGRTPQQLLSHVRMALGPMAGSVRRNGQAVTMRFATGMNVDVVPASRLEGTDSFGNKRFDIPDSNRGTWITTVPRRHGSLIDSGVSVAGEQFRKVIKYAKHWNARVGAGMQGFHIENIALSAVDGGWRDDSSWATLQWFDKATETLTGPFWFDGLPVDEYMTPTSRSKARQLAQVAYNHALIGWSATYDGHSDHRTAITSFKTIFGQKFPGYGG